MSKYIPEIFLKLPTYAGPAPLSPGDPLHDDIAADVSRYSITPRTLKSVKAFDFGVGAHTSIEEYAYVGNTVLRYSIRADAIIPDPITRTIFGEGEAVPKGSYSATSAKYRQSDAKKAILHSLEKNLITHAISTLASGSASTAVVDIFERNEGKSVNIDLITGHPITHSVVLHLVGSEVCVIDPSNFLHSSHLDNADFSSILALSGLPQIRTIHTRYQLYIAEKTTGTGSEFDKYRDCSDVAVKIAFGLNKNPLSKFDEVAIKSDSVLVRVSNQPSIDKFIIEDQIPARIKQTSSVLCQETFSKLQFTLNTKEKIFDKVDDDAASAQFTTDFLEIMTREVPFTETLNLLKDLDDRCNAIIDSDLRQCIGDVVSE